MSRRATRCQEGKELFEALLTAEGEHLEALTRTLREHLSSCPVCASFLEEEEEEGVVLSIPQGMPPLPRRGWSLPRLRIALPVAGAVVLFLLFVLFPFFGFREDLHGPGVRGFLLLRGAQETTLSGLTLVLEVEGDLFPLPLEGPSPREGRFRLRISARREGILTLSREDGTLLARVRLGEGEECVLPEGGWFPPEDRLLLRFVPTREPSPVAEYLVEFAGKEE